MTYKTIVSKEKWDNIFTTLFKVKIYFKIYQNIRKRKGDWIGIYLKNNFIHQKISLNRMKRQAIGYKNIFVMHISDIVCKELLKIK